MRQNKCVAFIFTGAVMTKVLIEKAYFNIVIAIIYIAISVYVEVFMQIFYWICDSSCYIIFLFYQKNFNELFCLLGCENIWAELTSAIIYPQ